MPTFQPHSASSSFINPEYFKEDFSVDAFLVKLTQDVIDTKQQQATTQGGRPISNEESARATIDRVQKLIKRFIQAEYEIAALGNEVTSKLQELQECTTKDETQYKAEVRTLERVSERIKDGIRDIDARVSRISQTATRVGDRLQTAEGLRLRCLEAQELISHLQAFSVHSAGEDFSKLPAIFTNDATLAEAAAVSRRLQLLAGDVAAAKQRTKLASSIDNPSAITPGNTGGIGSVEHTLKVLEGYCNWLENRVVSRFDAAVADNNLKLQAQSVAIMIELDKERSIAQRWVASRPMFLAFSPEVLDDWVRRASRPPPPRTTSSAAAAAAAAVDAADAAAGTAAAPESGSSHSKQEGRRTTDDYDEYDIVARQAKALADLYKDMHASVKEDVADAKEVFTQPDTVMEMFMQRLLEQNVQAALERLLLPTGMGMAALAAATTVAQQTAAAAAAAASPAASVAGMSPSSSSAGPLSNLGSFKERAKQQASSFAAAAAAAVAASGGSGSGPALAGGGSATSGSSSGPQPAALQRQQLRLLAEAYSKTQRLALNLERAVRAVCQLDVVSMAEGLWPAFMGNYPMQELSWLQAAYQEEVLVQDSPELSLALCQKVMSWNAEATRRALKLSAPGQAPRNCRMLFHHLVMPSAGPGAAAVAAAGAGEVLGSAGGAAGSAAAPAAHPGCLLEHLARHIIGGVEYSLELCSVGGASSISSIFKLGFGNVSKASSIQMAAAFVNDKIRKALEAAHIATEVMAALQAHFSQVVAPPVSGSVAELSAASSALLSLIRAAEDSITVVLRKSVDTFTTQMERVLSSEQRRSDFTPRDDALSFDRPTSACLLGTALLAALGDAVRDTLDGTNRRHFLTEVSLRSYQLLLTHMTRYTYSPTGALKWKKDVNEYAEVLASYQVPSANEDMAHLQQLVNVLVVAPESLLGLVNGSLRMAHRDALRFIALREDFKTAKVDGKTLLQLFSGEGMEGQLG